MVIKSYVHRVIIQYFKSYYNIFKSILQIKTHLQSKTNVNAIAVGHQHEYTGGMAQAIKSIYSKFGFTGLWRGSSSAAPRVAIGRYINWVLN